MATSKNVQINRHIGSVSDLDNGMIGINDTAHADTGEKVMHYKDADGVGHHVANLNEDAKFADTEVDDLTVNGALNVSLDGYIKEKETTHGRINIEATYSATTSTTTNAESDSELMTKESGSSANIAGLSGKVILYEICVIAGVEDPGEYKPGTEAVWRGTIVKTAQLTGQTIYTPTGDTGFQRIHAHSESGVEDTVFNPSNPPSFAINASTGELEITVQHTQVGSNAINVFWQAKVFAQYVDGISSVC
jgi:hypothetical protein